MRKEQGFSIIELMIVLIVLGVLVAIGVPAFRDMIANNRITSNTNTFIGAFSYARTEAIRSSSSVTVTSTSGSTSWGSGLTIWQDADADNNYDAGEELRIISSFPLSTIEAAANSEFTFSSSGLVDNSETFEVCDARTGETGRTISLLGGGGMSVINSVSCL